MRPQIGLESDPWRAGTPSPSLSLPSSACWLTPARLRPSSAFCGGVWGEHPQAGPGGRQGAALPSHRPATFTASVSPHQRLPPTHPLLSF